MAQSVTHQGCDLDLKTDKRGSPDPWRVPRTGRASTAGSANESWIWRIAGGRRTEGTWDPLPDLGIYASGLAVLRGVAVAGWLGSLADSLWPLNFTGQTASR